MDRIKNEELWQMTKQDPSGGLLSKKASLRNHNTCSLSESTGPKKRWQAQDNKEKVMQGGNEA